MQVVTITIGNAYSNIPVEEAVMDALMYLRYESAQRGLHDAFVTAHTAITKIILKEHLLWYKQLGEWGKQMDSYIRLLQAIEHWEAHDNYLIKEPILRVLYEIRDGNDKFRELSEQIRVSDSEYIPVGEPAKSNISVSVSSG